MGSRPAAALTLQRDPKPVEGVLNGVTLRTGNDGAKFCTTRKAQLLAEQQRMFDDMGSAIPQLSNVALDAESLVNPLKIVGEGTLDVIFWQRLEDMSDAADAAMSEAEARRALVAADKVRQARKAAEASKVKLAELQAKVDDKKPAALRVKDSGLLTTLWNWSTALYDSSLSIAPLVDGSLELERELVTSARAALVQAGPNSGGRPPKYVAPDKSVALPVLDLVAKVIAGYQAVSAVASLVAGGTTASESAKSGVSAAVTLASSATTLFGICSGMGVQLNLYIGPMTDKCLQALGKLEDVGREINRERIKHGDYGRVNWDLENGGRPVFDFLLAVRSASGPEGVPQPVPPEVSSFFVSHQEAIEAGASKGTGDEMPTTGWWFWKKTDEGKIASWVFAHRASLWSTFYGSVQPGAGV